MAVYKMIYRDGDNQATSDLHVVEKFCQADTKTQATKIFDDLFGPKWVVAGPLKLEPEKVPENVEFVN